MSEFHNSKFVGKATIDYDPANPDDAVHKQFVEDYVANALAPSLFVTDVTPIDAGNIGMKSFVLNTVPSDQVLASCFTDNANIRIHFLAEGSSSFYSPTITIAGQPAQYMVQSPEDRRLFVGYCDITLAESGNIILHSDNKPQATVNVTLMTEGPTIYSATLGALPNVQTAVKAGDEVEILGGVDNAAASIKSIALNATQLADVVDLEFGVMDSAGAGQKTFIGKVIIGSDTGTFPATIAAYNAIGTKGAEVITDNTVDLDQASPIIDPATILYPAGQSALKNIDSATVIMAITDADLTTVSYVFDNGSVDSQTYAPSKVVTRSSGQYVTMDNYTVSVQKPSNGTSATRKTNVRIAHAEPSFVISYPDGQNMRSDTIPTAYRMHITSSQDLIDLPVVNIGDPTVVMGTLIQMSPTLYTTDVTVTDNSNRGDHTVSVLGENQSTTLGSVITQGAQFSVRGIMLRDITFGAGARYAPIGASVSELVDCVARYKGADEDLTLRNDTADVFQAFTIVNSSGVFDANGDHLFISDAAFAGSNSSGTLMLEFEEF